MCKIRYYLLVALLNVFCFSEAQNCGFSCNSEQEAEANEELLRYLLQTQKNLGIDAYSTCSDEREGKVKLPVVFHLVYPSGTPSGTSSNLTAAKVNSLITQINDIFAHSSGKTFSNPNSGVDIGIEFQLANRDPSGQATNGIDRVVTNKYGSVGMANDTEMKTALNWNTNKYLNIYFVPNVIGAAAYALFPSFHGQIRDGVVVTGKSPSATLIVHELGHFLGLYHTFQSGCVNGDCLEDGDKVCDTPPKEKAGTGGNACSAPANTCSTDDDDHSDHNPLRPISLGGNGDQVDGYENYMDYTGSCYGAFTKGQKERMRATVHAVRKSLLSSDALYPPNIKDVAIERIMSPTNNVCDRVLNVVIKIKNNGNQTISDIPLVLELNGKTKKKIIFLGPLAAGETTEVIFEDIIFEDDHNALIAYTDWSLDMVANNNMICGSAYYQPAITDKKIRNDFESGLGIWHIENPDAAVGLKPKSISTCNENGNGVLGFESLVNTGSGSGSNDYLVSKTIDLTDATEATLKYSFAYRRFYSNMKTTLKIEASDNCGVGYNELESKSMFSLNSTSTAKDYSPFYPKNCNDWDSSTVDLNAYLGKRVTLRFNVELQSSQGQNLFLDNINIAIKRNDLPDCNGDIGGTASIDACGICSEGLTGLTANESCKDCNGEVNGTADIDLCSVCAGGNTGIIPDESCIDCNGDRDGVAILDACGNCVGGNTGIIPNASCSDCNGVPNGEARIDNCGVCAGGNTNVLPNETCKDCNGDVNGEASIDACGTCTGGNSGAVPNTGCTDCNGDLNGDARIDACGVCAGGNTGIIADKSCTDCNGVVNGTAKVDNCGICSGGNTGKVIDASCADCNGDANGTAVIDACGECAGGRTGIVVDATCMDCNGDLDGGAYIDLCGNCSDGNTGIIANSACTDCNGDVNGKALIDDCGVCSGGNTGIGTNSTCTDCNNEKDGTASIDACGECSGGSTGIIPDNSCVNNSGCSPIAIKPNVFCTPNTSVELKASSATGSCNNLKWYDKAENGILLSTGCLFDTPNLSTEKSYYVEDDINKYNTSSTKTTGYDFNSAGLSNMQPRWNSAYITEFKANETTTIKAFDVKFSNCNNSGRVYVTLRDKTSGVYQTYDETHTCNNNTLITLPVNFSLVSGHVYEVKINNTSNKEVVGYLQKSGNYNDYFGNEVTILRSGENYNGGFGPFFNWQFPSTCPRTEVKVFQNCIEQCGNGIDDDGDGQIDEACKDFTCSGRLLQSMGNVLYAMSISPFKIDTIAELPYTINSLAYNPLNNKVYATSKRRVDGTVNPIENQFIRIDNEGGIDTLGYAIKPNGSVLSSYSADIGYDGVYYVLENAEKILYSVDLETMLATPVVSSIGGLADIAYNPENGNLYGINGLKNLYEINPKTGVATNLGKIKGVPGLIDGGGVGAVYFSPTGELIAYGSIVSDNLQNDMIKIDVATLNGELISKDGFAAKENDGASCPYTVKVEKSASIGEVYPGDEFVYTIDVFNKTGFQLKSLNFTDVLPEGLEIQSVNINEIGTITNSSNDLIEIKNFPLGKGKSTLAFKVKLKNEQICSPYELPNQASISNLPAALGKVIYSDDPTTNAEFDTTLVLVNANVSSSLQSGVLNHGNTQQCIVLNDTLTIKSHTGKVEWQSSNDGLNWTSFIGQYINDSSVVVRKNNFGSTLINQYYRVKLTSTCDTQYSEVHYTIAPKTPRPEVSNVLYCEGDLGIPLTAIGTDLKWYLAPNVNEELAVPVPDVSVYKTTTYYVSQTLNGCESDLALLDVLVTEKPDKPEFAPYHYCVDEPGTGFDVGTTHLTWFDSLTDESPEYTQPTVDYSLPSNTVYYVETEINGCKSERSALEITILEKPNAPVGLDTNYCLNDIAVEAFAIGDNLNWFSDAELNISIATTPIPNTSVSGMVSYYVNQSNGVCVGPSDTVTIIVNEIPEMPIVNHVVYCLNDSVDSLTATGENLKWYVDSITLVGSEKPFLPSSLLVKDSSYFVSQTINNCESERAEILVTVNGLPDAVFNQVDTICPNSDVELGIAITEGNTGYTIKYRFNDQPEVTLPLLSTDSYTQTINDSGIYYLTEIIDGNGCENTNTDSVHVSMFSTLVIDSLSYECLQDSKEVQALFYIKEGNKPFVISGHNNINTIQPDTGMFTSNAISYSTPSNYLFSVSDASGCVVNTAVPASADFDCSVDLFTDFKVDKKMICVNDTVVFSTIAIGLRDQDTLRWDFGIGAKPLAGDTGVGPLKVVYTESGLKEVVLYKISIDADTIVKKDLIKVSVYPNANILTVEDSLSYCEGSSVPLIEGQDVLGASYQWYKDGVSVASQGANKNLNNVNKGEYRFEVTLDGCSDLSDSLLVYEIPNVTPAVFIKANIDTICPGVAIIYEVVDSTNSGGKPVFDWRKNNKSVASGNLLALNDLKQNDSVFVIMKASNICQTSDHVISNILYPIIRDTLSELYLVSGNLTPCDGDKDIKLELNKLNASYDWSVIHGDANLVSTFDNKGVLNVNHNKVNLKVKAIGLCNSLEEILEINPHKRPDLELFKNMEICNGSRDTLYVIDHSGQHNQPEWYKDNKILKQGSQYEISSITQEGEYYVIAINNGCADTSNSVVVKFVDPKLSLSASEEWIKSGESVTLMAQSNIDTLSWYSDNQSLVLGNYTSDQITVNLNKTTLFEAIGALGDCDVRDEIKINVVELYGVPYFFSPNGDGENDEWVIENLDSYQSYSIEIFNRWGNKVQSYHNNFESWKGDNLEGKPLPDGTYYYVIESRVKGETIALKGHVSIIR